ncbi:uncharacterized protein LOC100183317 [Ciona intestinalis]
MTNLKNIPVHQKVDLWASFSAILLLWNTPFMFSVVTNNHLRLFFPNEMLMHGPILINTSAAETDAYRLQCNPHFKTFHQNESYFTSQFKGEILEKAKSEEFLALPDVQSSLFELKNGTNQSRILFAFRASEICELILPNLETGGCMKYDKIVTDCLDGECGTDPNLCWWSSAGFTYLAVMTHAFLFLPGFVIVLLLLYDPPIIGLGWITRPILPAFCLTVSGLVALISAVVTSLNISKYVQQQILYDTYPGFEPTYGTSWYCEIVEGIGTFGAGVCFIYVAFCTPSYPRNGNRVRKRRELFAENLEKLGKTEKIV